MILNVLIFFAVLSSRGVVDCQIWNILLFTYLIYNSMFNTILGLYLFDGFTLILMNIITYLFLLLNLFGLFFLFDVRSIRTLNELKSCGGLFFVSISLIILLLSLAGVPPLFGFIGKFLLFIYLIKTAIWFITFFFSLVNFFVIYFYIQNIRFMISKGGFFLFYFRQHQVFLDVDLVSILIVFNFFNIFGVLFTDDVILYFAHVSSFMFLN